MQFNMICIKVNRSQIHEVISKFDLFKILKVGAIQLKFISE